MNPETKIDPFETPVWALYGSKDDAQIIHACLPRWRDERDLPTRIFSEGGHWTSRGPWCETREELIEAQGILPSCSRCQKPFGTKNWCAPYPEKLRETNLCFHCFHWINDAMKEYGKPGHVVIGRTSYSWNTSKPIVEIRNDGQFYGHGGREFCIKLKSGELVKTNNLWCGGQIPDRFAEDMPDNASFERIPEPVGHGQGYLG